jgi:hypothetical protein
MTRGISSRSLARRVLVQTAAERMLDEGIGAASAERHRRRIGM